MDRPLDPQFLKQQLQKRYLRVGLIGAAVVTLLLWIPGWITPSVSKSRIRTAKVETGPMAATISASGAVVPEFEQVISSPIDTRVLRILKTAGAAIQKGQPILELDVSEASLALTKLDEQLSLKENRQAQLRIDLDKTLNDLSSQLQIKKLRIEYLKTKVEQEEKLFQIGGSSKEQVRQSKLELEIAHLELAQLERSIANSQQSLQNQLAGVTLETKITRGERDEAARQLELAMTKADRDGVLTWVVPQAGVTIRQGEVIAKIADLNAFRVEATVSDVHAARLAAGLPVNVKIDEETHLAGVIASVLPAIQNGIVTFHVALDDKTNRRLRANLRVDVHVITAAKEKTLRLKRGPFVTGEGEHDVFVIRDGVAVRMPVRIGLASFDHLEVVEGLREGEEVIISDMRDFIHMKEVKVK
jgi:HlyD family secretion protein